MKKTYLIPLFVLLALCGCRTSAPVGDTVPPSLPPSALLQKEYLSEVVRYLYRWHLDERDVDPLMQQTNMVFWVREEKPKLDENDRSQFASIIIPQVAISLRVKKPDYEIPEMKLKVKSDAFRITKSGIITIPSRPPAGYSVVNIGMAELREYLFRTRSNRDYPSPELIERMRPVVREEVEKSGISMTNLPTGNLTVHLAPLSPVANESWVFVEEMSLLARFASDIDLSNPAVWGQEKIKATVYNLVDQVVVSNQEAAGSNRFLTRDEVGRALYNCVVIGQRISITPRNLPGQ